MPPKLHCISEMASLVGATKVQSYCEAALQNDHLSAKSLGSVCQHIREELAPIGSFLHDNQARLSSRQQPGIIARLASPTGSTQKHVRVSGSDARLPNRMPHSSSKNTPPEPFVAAVQGEPSAPLPGHVAWQPGAEPEPKSKKLNLCLTQPDCT